jgi:hypothetical protein
MRVRARDSTIMEQVTKVSTLAGMIILPRRWRKRLMTRAAGLSNNKLRAGNIIAGLAKI